MPISAFEEEKQVAGGRPDIQKLIKMGMLKPEDIDPKTGQRKGAQAEYVLQTIRTKNPETGKYETVEIPVNMGHAKNEDFPGWRLGLNPQKYWEMLEKQHYNRTYRNRKDTYAPELTAEEAKLFSKWLDDNIVVVDDKEDDEVPNHPIVKQKRKARKKKAEEKKSPGRPKKSPDSDE